MSVEGHQAKDGEDMQAFMNAVSPGYFEAMGVPLLAGRDFDSRDEGQRATVIIVNRKFAEHFFGSVDKAIGRHTGFGGAPDTKLDMEIIGVVENSLVRRSARGCAPAGDSWRIRRGRSRLGSLLCPYFGSFGDDVR